MVDCKHLLHRLPCFDCCLRLPLGLVPWSVALWAGMVVGSFGALYVGLSDEWSVCGWVVVVAGWPGVAGWSAVGAAVVFGLLVGLVDAGFVADLVVEVDGLLVGLQPDVAQLVSGLVDCYWDRASIRVLV